MDAEADDQGRLAAVVVEAIVTSRSLAGLLRSERALVSSLRYDALIPLAREKHTLLVALAGQTAVLRAAGREAILTLPQGDALVESVRGLDEATRADVSVVRCAIAAIDRIAAIIRQSLTAQTAGGYGRGGRVEAHPSGGLAMNDRA